MSEFAKHLADHSQWGEQEIILKFFGTHVGRFLDLGAYDGVDGSNSRGLSDRFWSGVCVEANPFSFARLVENHSRNDKVICVNAAVMPTAGLVLLRDTQSQIASCADNPLIDAAVVRRYHVAGVTPDDLVATFGTDWDFVSIDIEGVDLDVLRVAGRLLEKTRLVCFEDALPYHGFEPEYYDDVLGVLRGFGLTRIVGRTSTDERSANTLVARP